MRVAQVRLNQDMSFGKRNVAGEAPLTGKEGRAATAIFKSGHKIQRRPHGWFVFDAVGNLVTTLFGKNKSYTQVARNLALEI